MPTINPDLIPSVAPGNLFNRLTTDTTLDIRWLVALDPVYFDVLNRPLADIAVRQLIIAKTLDQVNLRLGHQSLFPFVVQAKIISGTSTAELPASWIWDMHVSLPQKWEDARLAKIIRISGENGTDITGRLRLMFTARQEGSSVETAVFFADYDIESVLTYQRNRIQVPGFGDQPVVIDPGEAETIGGFITFRTLDTTDQTVIDFFTLLDAPVDGTDADADGEYDTPAEYEILDSTAGGSAQSNDFSLASISHGTGMLTDSAWNAIPSLDSDASSWINAFNYPFRLGASRTSVSPTGVTIPQNMFQEFNLITPAGDQEDGDISGTQFPVWVNRIERLDSSADSIRIYFATHNVSSQPSLTPIEFATLDLLRTNTSGEVLAIVPENNLFGNTDANFQQGFGRGHVVLSVLWGGTTSAVEDFFDSFLPILSVPPAAVFTEESTKLSSYAISRVPQYTPTVGQAEALFGTASGRLTPLYPDTDNKFVVDKDEGLGDEINFATSTVLPAAIREHTAIDPIANKATNVHKAAVLIIDESSDDLDYDRDILPRLIVLFGRSPIPFDTYWDGTKIKTFVPDRTGGGYWVG